MSSDTDPAKLTLRRKTQRELAWGKIQHRYFKTWIRGTVTISTLLLVLFAAGVIHLWGKRRSGEVGMGWRRAESQRIATAFIDGPAFEGSFVEPLREWLNKNADEYSRSPRVISDRILAATKDTKHHAERTFRRAPTKLSKNQCVETLRNVREHLALRGLDVREFPETESARWFVQNVFVPSRLIELESRYPGICPQKFPRAVPLTCEILTRAIARSFEITPLELGELVYCSGRIAAVTHDQPHFLPASDAQALRQQ